MKRLHMTGEEVGTLVSIFNNMVKAGILTEDMLPHPNAKSVFHKVQYVKDEEIFNITVTHGGYI